MPHDACHMRQAVFEAGLHHSTRVDPPRRPIRLVPSSFLQQFDPLRTIKLFWMTEVKPRCEPTIEPPCELPEAALAGSCA